jgi:uncharacterized protein
MRVPAPDRDRDARGRPRNARPRDGLGRPLAHDAAGEPTLPDDLNLSPDEAVLTAQRLIDAGRPFHAHEVLEAVWKTAPASQRAVWKGLAQVAVGLTHARRGNSRGAISLLRRGADAVDPAADGLPARLDLRVTRLTARRLADEIEAHGLPSLTDADLRLPMLS